MRPFPRVLLALAAVSGLMSVAAGAFSAHAASPATAGWIRTAASYQMSHALAVFACAYVADRGGRRAAIAAMLFLGGAVVFCGGLYSIALGAPRLFATATPVGGLAFMAGWIVLAWTCMTLHHSPEAPR